MQSSANIRWEILGPRSMEIPGHTLQIDKLWSIEDKACCLRINRKGDNGQSCRRPLEG